jgi:dTDP-4-dehydrorhamnose 3,5-epimerase
MKVTELELPGLLQIEPRFFRDARGFFAERFNQGAFAAAGLPTAFVQDNHSRSLPKVLRGLHFQLDRPQGKLVCCIRGRIWDVAVDLRSDSKTFGKFQGIELNETNGTMLYIPPGFAHGFCVLGDSDAEVFYKVTTPYNPKGERTVSWNDPGLAVGWPYGDAILSPKDELGISFAEYQNSALSQSNWWAKS